LAKKCPVLGYQIQDQNFDGQSFAQFVKKRQRCRLVTHGILDRATIHSAKTSKKRKLEESVAQLYEQAKVQRDFYPPGFSHWQPVEKCINYIDSEIVCRATKEKQDGEWDKDRLKIVLQEIIENISLTSKLKDSIEPALLKCILKSRSQHISDQKNVQNCKSNKAQSHLFCLPLHFCRNLCDKTKLFNNSINILHLVRHLILNE
jgi:hypothetical protein